MTNKNTIVTSLYQYRYYIVTTLLQILCGIGGVYYSAGISDEIALVLYTVSCASAFVIMRLSWDPGGDWGWLNFWLVCLVALLAAWPLSRLCCECPDPLVLQIIVAMGFNAFCMVVVALTLASTDPGW